ncbi:ATP-binding protein [Mesorhizobium sp. ES1-4]|uniref:ATP-binding protein n=1 Tax=Mesorhizobium sp. ES1-4 TaxID=2876627 RepID=UPI001CCD1F07|nr:ATP-binding protein [Mesorhizobium sp. ES1-4]MBZ9799708.1 ATP-binding protein [Mesorhizobium sp. ES1-4]
MRYTIETLTFDLAGDICLAAEGGSLVIAELPRSHADALGPLLELRHVRPEVVVDQNWLTTTSYATLLMNMTLSQACWYEPTLGRQGFISIAKLRNDALAWPDFMIRAKRAAQNAGFSDDYAGKLAAAIGEFYSNVIEHSQNLNSGYIVFCAKNRMFEFVVADAGIGVLNSLRSNPRFANLGDSGRALELALSEGVTRHTDPDRGNGFRPLFVGLANISRFIRFRSDDHSRELIRADDGTITALTRQVSKLSGFFCSVLCEAVGSTYP